MNNKNKVTFFPYSFDELKEVIKQAISEMNSETSKEKTIESEDAYLSQKEAARFLRVSPPTIIKWKKEGKIPYYQEGRTILFKRSELLEALRKNEDLIK
jgi:excisionase family DNA binding protein